jgi:hypothetical protein
MYKELIVAVIEGNYLHKGKLEVAGDERQARTAITKV